MSYCRFSSDNWQCDLYCYGNEFGYFTHVAAYRVVGDIPTVNTSLLCEGKTSEFLKEHKKQSEYIDIAKREPLKLEHAGQSFRDPDLNSFLNRLLNLRELGYRIPNNAIEQVIDELKELHEIKHTNETRTKP